MADKAIWLVTDIIEIYTHVSSQAFYFFLLLTDWENWWIQWLSFFSIRRNQGQRLLPWAKVTELPDGGRAGQKSQVVPQMHNHALLPTLREALCVTSILTVHPQHSFFPLWTPTSHFSGFPLLWKTGINMMAMWTVMRFHQFWVKLDNAYVFRFWAMEMVDQQTDCLLSYPEYPFSSTV